MSATIRPATREDREFVLAAARRLGEFDTPPWRTPEEIVEGEARTLRRHFEEPAEGAALLIAEASPGAPLGFAYVETIVDYFTGRSHAHVGILAVAREGEGRGAGRALLEAAERWARSRGDALLTLNVFEANRHARAVYDHLGFRPETLRYVKPLA